MHGGLTPEVDRIDEIKCLDRITEIPHEGAMCGLLWGDPEENMAENCSFRQSPRGAGNLFGKTAVVNFCFKNNIELICRAHQLVMEGYKEMFDQKLVTVWSAPNYCYRCGNTAAILDIQNSPDQR